MIYSGKVLLFIRALTPLHVGSGRGTESHVDLPIQRDEFGFPTIWSSSLKGAIKFNIHDNAQLFRCLGSEPEEVPSTPSKILISDAKLFLIPVRTLRNVYSYATSHHLIANLERYAEVAGFCKGKIEDLDKVWKTLDEGKAVVSSRSLLEDVVRTQDGVEEGILVVNEVSMKAVVYEKLIELLGLAQILPKEIKEALGYRGLILLPDKDNTSLNIANRSLIIQYRVRLSKTKTVDVGPWSEEYLPTETTLVSLVACTDTEKDSCGCDKLCNKLNGKTIFVGGKETIGRGLVKLYFVHYDQSKPS